MGRLTLTSPGFYVSTVQNTVGKGEIARNEQFLCSHRVFYPFRELSAIVIKFEIVVCKLPQFGRVQNLSSGKSYTFITTVGHIERETI